MIIFLNLENMRRCSNIKSALIAYVNYLSNSIFSLSFLKILTAESGHKTFILPYSPYHFMSSSTATTTITTSQIPAWNFKADYVETCNCDYGCPCNFNGFPTYGNCSALVLYHIRSGNYSNTKLDGLCRCTILAKGYPRR